jgi:hypothetical protein
MTKEQVIEYNRIEVEIAEATSDLQRVNDFLARDPANKDSADATTDGNIFVKFAGTGCSLPVALFNGHMVKQKKILEDELLALQTAFDAL